MGWLVCCLVSSGSSPHLIRVPLGCTSTSPVCILRPGTIPRLGQLHKRGTDREVRMVCDLNQTWVVLLRLAWQIENAHSEVEKDHDKKRTYAHTHTHKRAYAKETTPMVRPRACKGGSRYQLKLAHCLFGPALPLSCFSKVGASES